ncbi:MAG: amidohydrolase [Ferruginibacter sp.]
MKWTIAFFYALLSLCAGAQVNKKDIDVAINKNQTTYTEWYKLLHAQPELSTMEINTAAYLQNKLKGWGFQIIDSLGYHSFAAILKNGEGPVVMYRTDMDGLPVKEQTGIEFASTATAIKNNEVKNIMHACGHDLHMSAWLGTAQLLTNTKKNWKGTLILLAESAEETGQGAKAVIASSNFKLLPRPDFQLAFHDHSELPVGQAGFCDSYSMAAVDMLNITFNGKGGHGAVPQQTIDPVLLASQYVVAIQSVVSRNLSPNDPAVITVGVINGGTAANIIPDQVTLKLTIRSYSKASRQLILERLKTIADNMARAAGLGDDLLPLFDLLNMSIPSVYNDPQLGARLKNSLINTIDSDAVSLVKPVMIGEDFGVYGQQTTAIPSYLMWIGTVSPQRKALANQGNAILYSLHAAKFLPDYETAIPAAIRVMTVCILDLLLKVK